MVGQKGILPYGEGECARKNGLMTFGCIPLLSLLILISFTENVYLKFGGACLLAALHLILLGLDKAKILNTNRKGNEGAKGLIEEMDATHHVTTETYQKFDAFLSHSGQQKIFVRQLYKDLTNQGVSCFFDQDPQSLPLAQHFPSRIFEAAKTCKVAVLLLSKDFLESKWPMLELSAFVQAREKMNPNLKILPLFYNIPPDALNQITIDNKKWNKFEKSKEKRAEMQRALRVVRGIKGLPFSKKDDKVKFREKIVEEIRHALPMPSPRYDVRGMQGEERMCQELANVFSNVRPNRKGICIAGLYGIAGQGKSTLAKAFCNFKFEEFEGRVCHLEFSEGDQIRNIKLALQYLTPRPDSDVQSLRTLDQGKLELESRLKHKRVLLVLDNIAKDCIDEVLYYLKLDLKENSWVLLSARSVDVLVKHFPINKQSCMRVPRLEEKEAIHILLERAVLVESNLGAEDRRFALKCAERCLFKEVSDNGQSFHPLALKAFGGYLWSKYRSNLSDWVDEIDGIDGLDDVFALLDKAFEGMPHIIYRTIFMLLAVYMLPNMSPHKVKNWLAINCNREIKDIEKAVEDLVKMAFIEKFESELRIHDLYIEFAQWKVMKMERWLWWKEDEQRSIRGLISQNNAGFELAKLEQCTYPRVQKPKDIENLLVLQLLEVNLGAMSKIALGPMDSLRSITLRNCKSLEAVEEMEKLLDLKWIQITGVHAMFKLPELSSLEGLQYLQIVIAGSQVLYHLGDLTHCSRLREIYVLCPSLLKFPRLKGMKLLEKVEFSKCGKVKGPLNCRDCVKLETIVLNLCCNMAASPLVSGCKKLSKLIFSKCFALTACPVIHVPSFIKIIELSNYTPKYLECCYRLETNQPGETTKLNLTLLKFENLELWNVIVLPSLSFLSNLTVLKFENPEPWNMGELMELPSFESLSNLTVLKLVNWGIREPPDLTGCKKLQNVYFFSLKKLKMFPNFSSLRELKKLIICDCIRVKDPPDIGGCHNLQVFHLLHNDNMKGSFEGE